MTERKHFRLLAAAFLALPFTAAETGFAETKHIIDFERPVQPGQFTEKDWEVYDGIRVAYVEGPERASIDESHAHSGKQSLRISYPEGSVGPSRGGHQAKILLEPAAEYCLSYWLRFGEDFSWGGAEHGGKLPGLAQGASCSGGMTCDGGNGFTARYMWRRDGAAVLYLYHMDKPDRWGEDFPLSPGGEPFVFPPGEWVNLAQRVRINSGTDANGEVQVWVNGIPALDLDGLRFVTDGSGVDTFYVSTFHGGNTPEWSPRHDSFLWIDDVRITAGGPCPSF